MVPLTASDKKLIKQITSFPWPADTSSPLTGRLEEADDCELSDVLQSYAPLEEQLQAAAELSRRCGPQRVANVAAMMPGKSESYFRNLEFDTCLHLPRSAEAAIARRFLEDNPEELIRFGVIDVRINWVMSGHGKEGCAGMWGEVLAAVAIGDHLVLDRLLATLPQTVADDDFYPFVSYYPRLYNAVLGTVRGDWELARRSIEQLQSERMPGNEAAIVTCLRGIVDKSPELVAEGLKARATMVRKVRYIDPHFKLLDGTLHCLFQLCQRIDPGLTALWDTGQRLPWDAEFHERLQAGGDPLQGIDLSVLSEGHRRLLVELPQPDWWSEVSDQDMT